MKTNLHRLAAALAFIIGAMALLAGGQVLLGRTPGYTVIGWLPIYNFIMGGIAVFIAAILIWKRSLYAFPAAAATLGSHALVALILLLGYGDVVARESLMAMTLRMGTWIIILALVFFGGRQKTGIAV